MRKMPLYLRILIPALAVLILLPPASYLIFRAAAEKQATAKARADLAELCDRADAALGQLTQTAGDTPDAQQTAQYLRSISYISRSASGEAGLLVFAGEGQAVYPYEEQTRAELAALIEAAREADEACTEIEAGGERYLVTIGTVSRSPRLGRIVAYCPVASVGEWIDGAGRAVLWISLAFAMLLAAVLVLVARSITKPLRTLCGTARALGEGDFTSNETAFPTREPEELRRALNAAAAQLAGAQQAQRTFFGNVSHELRTPLTAIGGYAQGIREGVFEDPRPACDVIISETGRMTELVNELLTLSRLDLAGEQSEKAPVDLAPVLFAAMERARGAALARDVTICTAKQIPALPVTGDARLAEHIFDNLLSNAVRHAKKTVTVEPAAQGETVSVAVRDDGDGIAAEDLPHLFERGYKGKNGHFGLGLAIAESAAAHLGGTLAAANDPAGGACFTLTLPRRST